MIYLLAVCVAYLFCPEQYLFRAIICNKVEAGPVITDKSEESVVYYDTPMTDAEISVKMNNMMEYYVFQIMNRAPVLSLWQTIAKCFGYLPIIRHKSTEYGIVILCTDGSGNSRMLSTPIYNMPFLGHTSTSRGNEIVNTSNTPILCAQDAARSMVDPRRCVNTEYCRRMPYEVQEQRSETSRMLIETEGRMESRLERLIPPELQHECATN